MKQNKIPEGIYCYDLNGVCPHWSQDISQPEQLNGFCSLLNRGDWDGTGFGELWDQCKECGINDDMEEDELPWIKDSK